MNTSSSGALRDALDATGARLVECCVADFSSNARGKTVGRDDFLAMGGCRLASVVLGLTLVGENAHELFGEILPSSFQDVDLVADPATLARPDRPAACRHGASASRTDACAPRGADASTTPTNCRRAARCGASCSASMPPAIRRAGGARTRVLSVQPPPRRRAWRPDRRQPPTRARRLLETGCEADSAERAGAFRAVLRRPVRCLRAPCAFR